VKRAVLTGGTGFVGASLARRLLRDGHEVHLLVRPEHARWRIADILADVRLHLVDLGDLTALTETLGRIRPDWVFHLAAYGAYSSQTDLDRMLQTNVLGTINLVRAGLRHGFEAFVNTGSSSEYGYQDHPPAESELIEPNSHYAVTKASATLFCRYTAQSEGVRLPTLRLYSVYGPWEEPTRLLPTLIVRGLQGRLPPLVNPAVGRDFVYAEDVNDAYLLAATRPEQEPGAVYNIGSGAQTTIRDAVDVARRVLHIPEEPVWGSMPDRRWDTQVWVGDNRKARQALGWEPRMGFEDGFRLFAAWLRDHPSHRAYYEQRVGAPD